VPYQVALMATQGILSLRYYGTVDAKERLQSLDKVLGMCKERRIRKVLVDFKEQETPTAAMDSAIVSSTLAGAGLAEGIRVAYILPGDVPPSGSASAVSKKSVLESRVFSSPDSGCLWLSEC
jgi:hypothetical protein